MSDVHPRLLAGAVAFVVLLELAIVWGHPWFPSNDGPAHQYTAWVVHELETDPQSSLAETFRRWERRFYPNAGYETYLEAVAGQLDLRAAEKLGVSLYLVALPLALLALCRSLGREGWISALAAAGLATGFPLFMGFFNFLWGVPLALLFLALLQRALARPSPGRLLGAGFLLAATFWAHLVAFGVAVAGGLVWIAISRAPRRWLALLAVVPVLAIAPWFWPRTVEPDDAAIWDSNPLERLAAFVTLQPATAFGGAERSVALLVGLALAGVAIVCLARERAAGRREIGALLGVLIATALVAPSAIGAGSVLDKRLLWVAWLPLAAAIEPLSPRLRAATAAILVVAIAAHIGFLQSRFAAFDDEMTTYLSALERIRPGKSLHSYTEIPPHEEYVVRPIATANSYYHLALRTPSYSHYPALPGAAGYFPIAYTEAAKRRFATPRRRNRIPVERLAGWADYVVVWGSALPELRRLQRRPEYLQIYWRGPLRLFRRLLPGEARPESAVAGAPGG